MAKAINDISAMKFQSIIVFDLYTYRSSRLTKSLLCIWLNTMFMQQECSCLCIIWVSSYNSIFF